MSFLCVYALYRRLFYSDYDKKLFKAIWGLQSQAPIMILSTHIITAVSNFLKSYCSLPKMPSGLKPKDRPEMLIDHLSNIDNTFQLKLNRLYNQFISWTVRMESKLTSSLTPTDNPSSVLGLRSTLVMTGIMLANQVKYLV